MKHLRHILIVLLLPALLLGLPLLGVWLVGKPVADYFEFPPLTRYVTHAGFAWPVFIALAAGIVGFLAWALVLGTRKHGQTRTRTDGHGPAGQLPDRPTAAPSHRFPAWGWAALALTAAAWLLAWTRFGWFAPCQKYSFIPLWLGYILTVNALTFRRTGRCMLTHRTAHFLALFPASMVFWWFFEYLNRFVQNWYYIGAEGMGPLQYTVVASLSFSTVLPAVLGTAELLETWRIFARGNAVTQPHHHTAAPVAPRLALLTLCAGGLAAVGVWPDYLFPLLWLAPLGLMLGLNGFMVQRLSGSRGGADEHGRARTGTGQHGQSPTAPPLHRHTATPFPSPAALMLAGLACGFFWEMWNMWSLAKWVYSVPFVDRFHLFEMPALGYAGYLPFGIECAAAALWIEFVFSPQRSRKPGETP